MRRPPEVIMKVTGLIAEYNPFHNGHRYHIRRSRQITGADFIVVVMSGDFVQRGAPALLDKFTRARMALSCGADLVLELPVRYALGSAEFFAAGGVALLDCLGAVDTLSFGSEQGDVSCLMNLSSLLLREPEIFRETLKKKSAEGLPFPAAREQALLSSFPDQPKNVQQILSSPNNILGIEYGKALLRFRSAIKPVTIRRMESSYHQQELSETFSSATALRRSLQRGELSKLSSQIPSAVFSLLQEAVKSRETACSDDYSLLMKYKLLSETADTLIRFQDVSPDLANRILAQLNSLNTLEDFSFHLKTRQMTYSRICRSLFHILLDLPRFSIGDNAAETAPYARILGFRKEASPLLHEIKKRSVIPLVSRPAAEEKKLCAHGRTLLSEDIRCGNLYESVLAIKNRRSFRHEASRAPVIL